MSFQVDHQEFGTYRGVKVQGFHFHVACFGIRYRELSSFRSYLRFLPNQELELHNADNFWTACTPPLFKLPTPDPELSQRGAFREAGID